MWDRLPGTLRRYRAGKSLLLTYMFVVFLPIQLTQQWEHAHFALRQALWGVTFVGVALMISSRRRATRDVQARSGVTAAEAAALLNTPTWRLSTWRRPAAAALLRGQAPPPRPATERPGEAPTALSSPGAAEHTPRPS